MNGYLIFILALLIFNWLLDLIVETLNVRNVSTEIPAEFQGIYDAEKYAKSQRYLRETTRFGQIQAGIMLPLTIGFILLGGFSWVNGIAQAASGNMIVQGLVFGGILMVLGQIVGLPFSIYDTFVIEERYGFNKTTVKTFVVDILKGLMLTVLLGAPVFALILWIFSSVANAWLWAWGALAVIQLFILFIAPVVILPLFNKFTPLEEGELRAKIEAFAVAQKYKLSGVFKIDGSKRSTKSNAYFTGFGKTKRIALFDTLIEKHTVGELVAVLAHEIGHCKRGHIKKGIVISLASSLLMFFILSLFITKQGLYAAFGIEGVPLYAGFIFFGFLYAPISMILGLLGNILSRKHEYEADAFAAETTGEPTALIDALKKLSVDNLSNLTPHPLKVFLEYSHPPVLERIKALDKILEASMNKDKTEGEISKKKKRGCLTTIMILGLVYFGVNFVMRDSIRDMGRQAAVQDVNKECLTEGAPTGFENALWLMTTEEVKQLFPNAKPFGNENSLLTETTAFNRPAGVGFEFNNDHLTMIIINFVTRSEDRAAYEDTQALLVRKYGAFSRPAQTPKYTLLSKRKFSRVNVEHLLYTLNGVPAEQVLIYRTKENSN